MLKNLLKSQSQTIQNGLMAIAALFLLEACTKVESKNLKVVKVDGSSTVYPITELAAEEYKTKTGQDITVEFSGTVEGFTKFCNGETEINNASIPIPQAAMKQCKENKIAYIELPIAFDPLTIVVNKKNDWVENLTLDQLNKMWRPSAEGRITKWSQINPNWSSASLNLLAPGKESGTYEYFTAVVMGEHGVSRQDYVYNQDDQAIANGVSQDPNSLGYFGYSYYKKNQDNLKAVPIVNASGVAVEPSITNVENGSYNPFARPLFIYVNLQKAQQNQILSQFVEFYLEQAANIVSQKNYVALPNSAYRQALIHFEENQVGTVFNGSPVMNLTLNELLSKSYAQNGESGYVY
jgi:phosphate transport system substrate-binding protein